MQTDTDTDTGAEPLLKLEGVCAGYGPVQVLHDVSLSVRPKEIVALIGSNGAGKTTTLNTVVGTLPKSKGKIFFDGRSLESMPPELAVQMGIGYVPERRQLFPSMSVQDNLTMGAYHRYWKTKRSQLQSDMEEVFTLFPVLKERRRQLAGTLSGGQQQMVAVGRGLMSKPKLLLLDDPSLGLAPMVIREVMQVIRELKNLGLTVLLVEQNARAALRIADRCYIIENGAVGVEGCPADLAADTHVQAAYLGQRKLNLTS